MQAVKAKFDGSKIILPKGMRRAQPGEVIVIFSDGKPSDSHDWLKAQEQVLESVWSNPEDAEYDEI